MIKINKGNEPAAWTQIKQTPGIAFDNADKTALRDALLREQGFICGYCMRRVSNTTSRIEHLKPQTISIAENHPEETMDYHNMIICCNGDIDGNNNPKAFHCDRKKGETPIHFTPFDSNAINTLSYSSKDGEIKSSDINYSTDINKTLNLNQPLLKANRQAKLKGVIQMLGRKNNWKKSEIKKMIDTYSSKDSDGKMNDYCGIVVWFLTKRYNSSRG